MRPCLLHPQEAPDLVLVVLLLAPLDPVRSSGCLLRFGFITRATDLPLLEAIAGPSDSGKRLYDFRALGG